MVGINQSALLGGFLMRLAGYSRVHVPFFQGSSSSQSRQEALLRHARPEPRDTPIALQRSTDVNVYVIDPICQSLIYKCVLHVSISCP